MFSLLLCRSLIVLALRSSNNYAILILFREKPSGRGCHAIFPTGPKINLYKLQYKKEITLNSALHSKRLKKLCLIRHFIVLVAVVLLEKGFCYPRGRRHHNLVPRVAQPLLLLSRTFYERSNSGYAMKPKKKKKQ